MLSQEFGEDLRSRYDFLTSEKICPFPNVPDLEQMESFPVERAHVKFEKKAPVIFYFGVIAERRGIFEALETFSKVITGGHKAQFLAIGPVDKKDLFRFQSYLNSPALKDWIIYIPWISLPELPSYLDVSDICLAIIIFAGMKSMNLFKDNSLTKYKKRTPLNICLLLFISFFLQSCLSTNQQLVKKVGGKKGIFAKIIGYLAFNDACSQIIGCFYIWSVHRRQKTKANFTTR